MNKHKLEILKRNGELYYSDTDSIVTDIPLENLANDLVGDKLGQFKLEYVVKEGIFTSNKTYYLTLSNGNIIKEAKGVKAELLEKDDYLSLLRSENVNAWKRSSNKDYSKGSVNIQYEEVLLYKI